MQNKYLFLNKTNILYLLLIRIKYFIYISKIDIFILFYTLFYFSLYLFTNQDGNNIFYYLTKNIFR